MRLQRVWHKKEEEILTQGRKRNSQRNSDDIWGREGRFFVSLRISESGHFIGAFAELNFAI